ncbi:bifunctional diguanylate cyclase/phosphodiesterase [Ruminococcus sp.]|jgi:diguanylate cyclase (GGDEF)-like protein|uniref:putative bifunctional diguanylate cyclase/phosphodiesterase n=1 Tax=Ruminococcus sp. TaxID=41978 RepID=UPI0025E9F739|nr:bifunctional diguanylate cyclase/phosphodiesterase [Ruminococcus sp.]
MKRNQESQKNIEKTLSRLSSRKNAPISVYIILLLLYIIAAFIIRAMATSNSVVNIFGASIPFYSFAGIFSALSEICVIFMTFYFQKKGYYTALGLLIIQLPLVLSGIIFHHNIASLPGVFSNLLAIIAITIIYFNNKQVDAYQKELSDQAVTDQLTKLPNRFACSRLLSALVERGDKFTLVSIDINGFKGINNTMGFETGNAVLCEIASRWKTIADTGITGTQDFITRLSGDEFGLIIRDYQTDKDIINTIKQYEAVLQNRLTVDNCDLYITASFGYAEFPVDAETRDSVFSYADAAMHEVKRTNSSNHILRFTPDLLKIEHTIEVEGKIRAALEKETIYFNLQPQFDMDHKLRGFEALARMKDADGTNISPGEFIPVSEKVGLVDKVDGMVFRKAAMFFGELLRKTGADIILSVNVSVRHLMKNDFLDEIRNVLQSSGVPAKNLEIEITESIMIDSVDKALQYIDELKAMGVQIAIDDFGTGYSSLSYLNRFPAHLLKVDKSFIDKMNTSESSRQYVSAIISIGHIMGFDVIAEGVEEAEQVDTLKEIGCDFIQGFVWGRPLMPDAAEKLVIDSVTQ